MCRVRLTEQAEAHLARLCESHHGSEGQILQRGVRWLMRQEGAVQLAVLRAVSPRSLAVLAKEMLRRRSRREGA